MKNIFEFEHSPEEIAEAEAEWERRTQPKPSEQKPLDPPHEMFVVPVGLGHKEVVVYASKQVPPPPLQR